MKPDSRKKQGGSRSAPPDSIPTPQPVEYFDGEGRLRPALVDSEAEERAKKLRNVTSTQLRRFYEEVLNLRQRIRPKGKEQGPHQEERAFEALRAEFKMLKAKAFYAHGRSNKIFPEELLQFFVDHVQAVNKAEDFNAFFQHFQAVVAFHRFYESQKQDS